MSELVLTEEEAQGVRKWMSEEFAKASPVTDRVRDAVKKIFTLGMENKLTKREAARILSDASLMVHGTGREARTYYGRLINYMGAEGEDARVDFDLQHIKDLRELCDALIEAKDSTQ